METRYDMHTYMYESPNLWFRMKKYSTFSLHETPLIFITVQRVPQTTTFKIYFRDQVHEHTTAMEMSLAQTIFLVQRSNMTEHEGHP